MTFGAYLASTDAYLVALVLKWCYLWRSSDITFETYIIWFMLLCFNNFNALGTKYASPDAMEIRVTELLLYLFEDTSSDVWKCIPLRRISFFFRPRVMVTITIAN